MIPTKVISFQIDHTKLLPGIYQVETSNWYTYDLRFKRPNRGEYLSPAVAHSLEHLMAVFFRDKYPDKIIYVGMMMCFTGAYVITTKDIILSQFREDVIECMQWILNQDEVPCATEEECGNYKLHDLDGAKREAIIYEDLLIEDFHSTYPVL